MEHRMREAIRYLGYGRHAVDEKTTELLRESFAELEQTAERRIIYRIFELQVTEDGQVETGGLRIASRNLAKNMKGCDRAVMLGATLGIGVDLLMKRYSLTEMPRVVVLQACAAAMLEEYLDGQQELLAEELGKEGYYLRPRFSPGYGDFDIRYQKDILRMLDCAKRIGLTMTEGSMLTPTKSVTALIGMSRERTGCRGGGCEECGKQDCMYRRNV